MFKSIIKRVSGWLEFIDYFSGYPSGWTEEKERDYQKWAKNQPDVRSMYQ